MIKNLVISGGGIRSFPILGCLFYLEENNYFPLIKSYYGTSAGAIICLLIILEYRVKDIIKIFKKYKNEGIFFLNFNFDILFSKYNVYDTSKIEKIIKSLIGCKLDKSNPDKYKNITMKELFMKTNKKLTCATVSVIEAKVKYFNHINQPDIPVYKLILMSCSIPLIFEPVKWRNNIYVDAGFVDNFPILCIPKNEIKQTLGIILILKLTDKSKPSNVIEFVSKLMSIQNNTTIQYPYDNIICLPVNSNNDLISTNNSDETIKTFIKDGYKITKTHFKKQTIKRRKSF